MACFSEEIEVWHDDVKDGMGEGRKDLHWYTRDKNFKGSDADALKDEIRRVKEEEEYAIREALGLAPKRSSQP
ncbi:hypothetical protein V6N13_137148 [Hibiscus sabdariffa]